MEWALGDEDASALPDALGEMTETAELPAPLSERASAAAEASVVDNEEGACELG